MYKLTNNHNGKEIGVTESLHYIKRNPSSGALIEASPEDAEGVAFNGVWNIFPRELLFGDDVTGMATIARVDVTDYINRVLQNRANIDYVAMMTDVEIPIEEEEPELVEEV